MNIKAKRHIIYYLFLLFFLGISIFLGFQTNYNRQLQTTILFLTGGGYILWGLLHHALHHDLDIKIMLEYVLMGVLGVAAVLLLLKGGL